MEDFRMDEKDRKIIIELQKNSRQSFSQIGKAVKLPKTVVAYRIKRLVDSGFINLFSTVINKKKLGCVYARLFLKFHNFDKEIEQNLLSFIKKRKGVHWVASLNGCYDFCIILLAKNIEELNKEYFEIVYKFSGYILDKDLSIAAERHYYQPGSVFGVQKMPNRLSSQEQPKASKLDEIDFKIINLMKQNSRVPLLELSEKLNVSPQTLRTRIKNLMKNSIISGFRVRLNYKMLGLHHFHSFLSLSNIDKETEKGIIDFISSFPSTLHIIKGLGKYDLEFESLLKSHFELYELLQAIKNEFPKNIQSADSALIYKIYDINTVNYEKKD